MKQFLLALCVLAMLLPLRGNCQTKTQTALVRTRVTSDMKGGAPIAGAEVKMKDGNRHTSGKDGRFSFPVRGKFEIESATKEGYVMIDPKYLKNFTTYSENAIPVIMEERSKLNRETIRQTQRINKQLSDENERLMQLNDSLLKANAITEAKYDSLEQARGNDYLNKIDMVREMAEAFANIDYEILEEYDRQVYRALSEGDFVRAFELLKSHKSVEELKQEIADADAAIKATEEMLSSAKQGRDAKVKEAADQCYRWYEYYKARFMNDSAAYYLEQRANIDNSNYDWQSEAASFFADYLTDFSNSEKFYMAALKIATKEKNAFREANSYCNIGSICHQKGDYENVLFNYNKALSILKTATSTDADTNVAICYNNIATYYYSIGQIDSSIQYFKAALDIFMKNHGGKSSDIALLYNNLGYLYDEIGMSDSALSLYNKSLLIKKEEYGDNHPSLIETYLNIGAFYGYRGDSIKSFEYFYKALDIEKKSFGMMHPLSAKTLNNLGYMYSNTHNYEKSLELYLQALSIDINIYGEKHPSVAHKYRNIGTLYADMGKYEEALHYDTMALHIQNFVFSKDNPEKAITYNNLAAVYNNLGDTNNAISFYKKAVKTWEYAYGKKHKYVGMGYANIGMLYLKNKEYKKAIEFFDHAIDSFPEGIPDIQTIKKRKEEAIQAINDIEKDN